MNDNRNDVDNRYIDRLKVAVIERIFPMLTKKDLLGWALSGNDLIWHIPHDIRCKITQKIVGDLNRTVLSSNKRYDDRAKQKGKEVFDTAGMNSRVKELMIPIVGTSEAVIKDIERNTDPVSVILTDEEIHFCQVHKEISKKGLKKSIEFTVVEKKADTEGNWIEAFHSGHTISYNRLAVGHVRGMGKTFFGDPFSEQAIDLLIHEAAHEKADIHTDKRFVDTCTRYGAKIAVFFLKSMAVKKPVQAVKRTPCADGMTVKDALKVALDVFGTDSYRTLKDIYARMGASTTGEKAGIRGILNLDCKKDNGLFERNSEGGSYRLRVA